MENEQTPGRLILAEYEDADMWSRGGRDLEKVADGSTLLLLFETGKGKLKDPALEKRLKNLETCLIVDAKDQNEESYPAFVLDEAGARLSSRGCAVILGMEATANALRDALTSRYPWLDVALAGTLKEARQIQAQPKKEEPKEPEEPLRGTAVADSDNIFDAVDGPEEQTADPQPPEPEEEQPPEDEKKESNSKSHSDGEDAPTADSSDAPDSEKESEKELNSKPHADGADAPNPDGGGSSKTDGSPDGGKGADQPEGRKNKKSGGKKSGGKASHADKTKKTYTGPDLSDIAPTGEGPESGQNGKKPQFGKNRKEPDSEPEDPGKKEKDLDEKLIELERDIFGSEDIRKVEQKTYTQLEEAQAQIVTQKAKILIEKFQKTVSELKSMNLDYAQYISLFATLAISENLEDFLQSWAVKSSGCVFPLTQEKYPVLRALAREYLDLCDTVYAV